MKIEESFQSVLHLLSSLKGSFLIQNKLFLKKFSVGAREHSGGTRELDGGGRMVIAKGNLPVRAKDQKSSVFLPNLTLKKISNIAL